MYRNPQPSAIFYGFPDIKILTRSRYEYNKRDLSYDGDALSGILDYHLYVVALFPAVLSTGYPGRFSIKHEDGNPNGAVTISRGELHPTTQASFDLRIQRCPRGRGSVGRDESLR